MSKSELVKPKTNELIVLRKFTIFVRLITKHCTFILVGTRVLKVHLFSWCFTEQSD